jgi:hypothetical protein
LLLVNPTGGQIGEGEGIGVAVFLTFFFFFFTGFLVAFEVLTFLVEAGLTEFFAVGETVAFFVGVALLVGLGVGVAACTFAVNIIEHSSRARKLFTFILCSI